jgi:multicomponent Na+:H+ antiporter subunit D
MNSVLIAHLPPAFILIIGALLLPLFKDKGRAAIIVALPVLTFFQIWSIPKESASFVLPIAGFDIDLLYSHTYTALFSSVFCIAAFMAGIFSLQHKRLNETVAAYIYAGSAIGITFCADLIGFFIYWELMALTSSIVIFCGGTLKARQAGLRYAYIHLLGGAILLCGIASYVALSGSYEFSTLISRMEWMLTLSPDAYIISLWLILIGILINAATPPLGAWLADAYPEASSSGSVFLSVFTTKTAVFALLTLFPGNELLIYVGLAMALYGLLYALLENNIRRALSYGLISQVGVMVSGIGIGTELALLAVALTAFGHIIYKGLWFMVAGAIIETTGRDQSGR